MNNIEESQRQQIIEFLQFREATIKQIATHLEIDETSCSELITTLHEGREIDCENPQSGEQVYSLSSQIPHPNTNIVNPRDLSGPPPGFKP